MVISYYLKILNDMAKKNFSGGIDSLFQGSQKDVKGEDNPPIENTRTTLIVNIETYEKIKAVAYWERKSIKDIVEVSFNKILSEYSMDNLEEILNHYRASII